MTGSVELFTVRLWQEALNEKQTEWRGKIQHIGSGEVRYFRDWSKMMEFINTTLSGLPSSQTAEVAAPSEYDRLHSGGGQKKRWGAGEVPQQVPAGSPVPVYQTWQQFEATGRPKKDRGSRFFQMLWKLWKSLPGGKSDRLRVVKNVGVVLIATLLFVFGLNHIIVIDPKTTSVIFGTKPLLVGLTGVFRGFRSRKQHHDRSAGTSDKINP